MIDEAEPKAWDQLPGESAAAYARFLIYRNLGPSRTIENACLSVSAKKSIRKYPVSGTWRRECATFEWVRRCESWDIEMLTQHGREVVLNFVEGLQIIARKSLEALKLDTNKPTDWNAAVSAINTIGAFIPGEAVQAVQSGSRDGESVKS